MRVSRQEMIVALVKKGQEQEEREAMESDDYENEEEECVVDGNDKDDDCGDAAVAVKGEEEGLEQNESKGGEKK